MAASFMRVHLFVFVEFKPFRLIQTVAGGLTSIATLSGLERKLSPYLPLDPATESHRCDRSTEIYAFQAFYGQKSLTESSTGPTDIIKS